MSLQEQLPFRTQSTLWLPEQVLYKKYAEIIHVYNILYSYLKWLKIEPAEACDTMKGYSWSVVLGIIFKCC
jgi:hypothetical protein